MSCFVECPRCNGLQWVGDGYGDIRDCPLCVAAFQDNDSAPLGHIALPLSHFMAFVHGAWLEDYIAPEWDPVPPTPRDLNWNAHDDGPGF